MTTPAGWYPFTQGNGEVRYWDGERWLEDDAEIHRKLTAQSEESQLPVKDKDEENDFNFREWSITRWIVSIIFVIVMGGAMLFTFFPELFNSSPDYERTEGRPVPSAPAENRRF